MPKAENNSNSQSPLIWIIITIIFAVMVFVFFSDRTGTTTEQISLSANQKTPKFSGEINRVTQAPPGLEARELIRQAREQKRPYPLENLHEVALEQQVKNNMADAHLLFFFCAREGYLPSILKMAEMSDPTLFDGESSLLDQADPVQAYKWYRIAAQRSDIKAKVKLLALKKWAEAQASAGDKVAQQLLLNFTN